MKYLNFQVKKNCGNKNVQDKQYVGQLNKELMNQMINTIQHKNKEMENIKEKLRERKQTLPYIYLKLLKEKIEIASKGNA